MNESTICKSDGRMYNGTDHKIMLINVNPGSKGESKLTGRALVQLFFAVTRLNECHIPEQRCKLDF
jgi:hypothetical protein